MAEQIKVIAVKVKPDGSPSRLADDMAGLPTLVRGMLIGEVEQMSDEELLHRCKRLRYWPASTEGDYVLLRIEPVILLCQLHIDSLDLPYGVVSGSLTVIRALPEDQAATSLDEERQRALEEERQRALERERQRESDEE